MENHTEHMADQGGAAQAGQTKTCTCWMGGCRCGHHKVIPILVVLFGLEFLLAQVNVLTWNFVGVTWPILVIIAGCMKLFRGACKCCCKK